MFYLLLTVANRNSQRGRPWSLLIYGASIISIVPFFREIIFSRQKLNTKSLYFDYTNHNDTANRFDRGNTDDERKNMNNAEYEIQTHKKFKRSLLRQDADTLSATFRGNLLCHDK